MSATKFECSAPNCPVSEIKKNQDRVNEKLDTMLMLLSEQKAISVDLNNLKKSVDELKDNVKESSEENKNIHVNIYDKINKLEQNKVDKTETKEMKGWGWALLIIGINFLLTFFTNILLGKGK